MGVEPNLYAVVRRKKVTNGRTNVQFGQSSIPPTGITMLKRMRGAQSLVFDEDTLSITGGDSRFLGWHFFLIWCCTGGYNSDDKALDTT